MSNRDKLRDAIEQSGKGPDGTVPAKDVGGLAMKLSSRFPQSGLTINSIEDEIRAANPESEKPVEMRLQAQAHPITTRANSDSQRARPLARAMSRCRASHRRCRAEYGCENQSAATPIRRHLECDYLRNLCCNQLRMQDRVVSARTRYRGRRLAKTSRVSKQIRWDQRNSLGMPV